MRREILHRDRVAALQIQEVIDANNVAVRDLARVTQLVHKALHHLFVRRDVRVQELENQALVHDLVLHEEHGSESALADLLDELVAVVDDIARFEFGDIERGLGWNRRSSGHDVAVCIGFSNNALLLGLHEQFVECVVVD